MQRTDLQRLLESHPSCTLAALADISVGLVLDTVSADDQPREALDALCAEAALTLGKPNRPALGVATCPFAVRVVGSEVCLFIRNPNVAEDALLCLCKSDVSIDQILEDVSGMWEDDA